MESSAEGPSPAYGWWILCLYLLIAGTFFEIGAKFSDVGERLDALEMNCSPVNSVEEG